MANFNITHSKYFSISDWLKWHTWFIITSYCWPNLELFCKIKPKTSKVQELSSKDSKERTADTIPILLSWTKVLGTVLQYSYFSVISRFPLKTVHPFRNFLAVLPPPTLYKVETRKNFRVHASNIVCGVREGVGPLWIGKRPRNAKVSQDFCPWL